MQNPQMLLQMALQRCPDPQKRQLIQNNINNPQQLVQELCRLYPNDASRIDKMIANGVNPQQIVMNMLGMRF